MNTKHFSCNWVYFLESCMIAFVVLVFSDSLEAIEIICPSTITVDQIIKDVPENWAAYDYPTKLRFVNVVFSEGAPEEHVFLAPSLTRKKRKDQIDTWKFQKEKVSPIWISCQYTSTVMMLSRELPASVTQCEVTYDRSYLSPVAKSITCKHKE